MKLLKVTITLLKVAVLKGMTSARKLLTTLVALTMMTSAKIK